VALNTQNSNSIPEYLTFQVLCDDTNVQFSLFNYFFAEWNLQVNEYLFLSAMLQVEYTLFCNLQSWARTHTVLPLVTGFV
jgi:hypothetical protein